MNENKLHYTNENMEHLENDDNILKVPRFWTSQTNPSC